MFSRAAEDTRSVIGRLYDRHGASLYRYALMLLGDRDAAQDAVQQVFVAILRQGRCFDDEERYLWRAMRNLCYSKLRQRRSEHERTSDATLLESVTEGMVNHDANIALNRAIGQLPKEQCEVVILHAFEGRTFQEIATLTETSANTIAARYRYALSKLKQQLAMSLVP